MTAQGPTAADVLTPPGRKMREQVEEGLEATKNLYQRGKERAIELEGRLEDKIRERPIKSVLIAAGVGAGVGLLIGVVLARR